MGFLLCDAAILRATDRGVKKNTGGAARPACVEEEGTGIASILSTAPLDRYNSVR